MTQPVPAPAPATDVTGAFSPDSLDILRQRVAVLDMHKMQITVAVRLYDPGAERPLRTTRDFRAVSEDLPAMAA